MSQLPIQIDATQLFYRYFVIPGVTSDWIDSRVVQTLQVKPGSYNFQIASGYYADFTFEVTPEGTINYDEKFNSFLSGCSTSTLKVLGFEVTLDARYLSGSGVLLLCPLTNDDWISYRTVRLVPASFYQVQQGSGVVTDLVFTLKLDGTFSYVSSYDRSNGGFLSGNGTRKLEFYGYPILVDARDAIDAQAADTVPAWGLTIQPIWGMPFTTTGVQYADLLPAKGFQLQIKSGIVSQATFDLSTDGTFSFNSSLPLQLNTFNGLKLLKATGALPH